MVKQRIDPILEQTFALFLVAVVAVMIGVFIYRSVTTDKYDYTQKQLEDKIQQTDKR